MRSKWLGLFALSIFLCPVIHAVTLQETLGDFKSDTCHRAFSYLAIGYYDHFQKGQDSEKVLAVSAPLLGYKHFGVDGFFTLDGNVVQEVGARFPIAIFKRVALDPYFFKNNDVQAYGWGIAAVMRLR